MNKPAIDILDYEAGDESMLQDPTDPYEQVEKQFMNKLGQLLTAAETALNAGKPQPDLTTFMLDRGEVLDLLEDPQVQEWLKHMRNVRRIEFRTYKLTD